MPAMVQQTMTATVTSAASVMQASHPGLINLFVGAGPQLRHAARLQTQVQGGSNRSDGSRGQSA